MNHFIFSLFALSNLVLFTMAADAQTQAPHFNQLLEDPVNYAAFRQRAGLYTRTSLDLASEEFSATDPLAHMLMKIVKSNYNQMVIGSIAEANASMTLVSGGDDEANLPQEYQELAKIFKRTLRRMGFTEDRIARARLYLKEGDENAFTMTSDVEDSPIIVVLQTALVEKLSYKYKVTLPNGKTRTARRFFRNELSGVMAHELMHDIAHHVILGMVQSLYDYLLISYYTEGTVNLGDLDAAHFSAVTSVKQTNLNRGILKKSIEQMRAQVAALQNNSGDGIAQFLQNYLAWRINLLQTLPETNPKIISFLESLRVAQPGMVKAEALVSVIKACQAAEQREKESTADGGIYFGTIPRLGAAGLSHFGGVLVTSNPDDEDYLENIERMLNHLRTQAQENYELFKKGELAEAYGGSYNHPTPNARVVTLLDFSHDPDSVAVQNPFLKRVVLYEGLGDIMKKAQFGLKSVEQMLNEIEKLPENQKTDEVKAQMAQLREAHEELDQTLKKVSGNQKQVVDSIVQLIAQEGFGVSNSQASVKGKANQIKELQDRGLRHNMRLINLVQYELARKNQTLHIIDQIHTFIQGGGLSPEESQATQTVIAGYKAHIREADELLKLILPLATGYKPQNENDQVAHQAQLDLLKFALDENLSSPKIVSRLNDLLKSVKSEKRDSNVASDARARVRTSSIAAGFVKDESERLGREKLENEMDKSQIAISLSNLQNCKISLLNVYPQTIKGF